MLVRPYYLTLLFSGDGEPVPVVSPDPGLEREWSKGTDYYKVIAWERPFPLWLAEAICQELTLLLADANCGACSPRQKQDGSSVNWHGNGVGRAWAAGMNRRTGRSFPAFWRKGRVCPFLPQVLAGRLFSCGN